MTTYTQENARLDDRTGRRLETRNNLRPAQWNVVGEKVFQERFRLILESMSLAVSRTLGPAGSTTIIEQSGVPHVTKDGWNVMNQFNYADRVDRNIYDMIVRIAGQVVSSVGDGTTTSIVAANAIRYGIYDYIQKKEQEGNRIRPRILIKRITEAIEIITSELKDITRTIDLSTEEGLDQIRKISMISTNSDEELTDAIVDIYRHTKNPIISVDKSIGRDTNHSIIDGYRYKMSYVDGQYAAGTEDWIVKLEDPYVLLFDHHVTREKHDDFIQAAVAHLSQKYANGGLNGDPILVIGAPFYDQQTMDLAREFLNRYVQAETPMRIIFTRVDIVRNIDRRMLEDLGALLGSKVLDERTCNDYNYFEYKPKEDGEVERVYVNRGDGPFDIESYLGRAGEAHIGNDYSLFRDLVYRNEEILDIRKADAEEKLRHYEAKSSKLGAVEIDRQEAIIRLSSLSCSMGSISVGADSSLHQEQKIDALDDAIKACESAYRHGYVMGGSFSIPYVITKYLECNDEDQDTKDVLELFKNSFLELFYEISNNAQLDVSVDEVFEKVLETQSCYNIETEEYDGLVVNPVQTDIQILQSAVSIVTLLLTSNQYLTQLPEFVIEETMGDL